MGGGPEGVNELALLQANKEWVYVAVDKVANATARVRLKAMRYKRNGDDVEVFDGPLVEFLEKPGMGFTGKDFVYLNTVYKELTGNSFWHIERKGKVRPLIPTQVSPIIQGTEMIGFRYRDQGQERRYQLKEVLHDRYIDPARPHWGIGKLQKIARWVDTSSFSNEFLRRFFLNGATFGGFIETEEETMERMKLIKAGLANDHVGVNNAHKLGILPKGAKFTQTTANMQQIEMGETDDRYRDKILSGFGVPKTLVGLTTEVNRATAEASEYIFAEYTIKPIVEDLCEFLNAYVVPMLGAGNEFYFAYDEFVPDNMEVKLKEREIALNRQPYKTVNEVRAEAGLPPVPGGDAIYGNPFQMPLGSPSVAPDAGPTAPAQNEPDDDEPDAQKSRPRGVQSRVRKFEKQDKFTSSFTKALSEKLADPQQLVDEADHRTFVGRVESYFDRTIKAVQLFNNEQQNRITKELGRITKDVNKGDLFNMEQEVGAMVNFVYPILRGLMTEQALAEYEAQGFEGSFDSGATALTTTVENATQILAQSYNDTTAKLLTKQLNEGIQAGESLADLTKRVASVYEFSNLHRAKAVAHTETFYIANEGNKEAYRQSGVVTAMRWYTAEDERVCPFCYPQNGRIVDVNGAFFQKGDVLTAADGTQLRLDYRGIDVPPLHTNCRCFIRPEAIDIGE